MINIINMMYYFIDHWLPPLVSLTHMVWGVAPVWGCLQSSQLIKMQTKNQSSVLSKSLHNTHKTVDAVGYNTFTVLLIRIKDDTDNEMDCNI